MNTIRKGYKFYLFKGMPPPAAVTQVHLSARHLFPTVIGHTAHKVGRVPDPMVKETQTCCGKVAPLPLKITLQSDPNSQARPQGPKWIKFLPQ